MFKMPENLDFGEKKKKVFYNKRCNLFKFQLHSHQYTRNGEDNIMIVCLSIHTFFDSLAAYLPTCMREDKRVEINITLSPLRTVLQVMNVVLVLIQF